MPETLYIFGASGHGRVVHSIAKALGYKVLGFLDDDASKKEFDGLPIVALATLKESSAVFVAIGNAKNRVAVSEKILQQGLSVSSLVHPKAIVDESVTIGEGTVVMAGAIIAAGCRLGKGVIVNHGSILDHDCTVGDYAHVCPGSSVAGGVKIGNGSWIGIGSTVIQDITIGNEVTVGAGSVVIRNLADKAKVGGVPARPL